MLSVVVLFHDGSKYLLNHWLENTEKNVKIEHELIVVDNTTSQNLKAKGSKVIHTGGNVLQFEGRRLGTEAAKGEYIFHVDSDDDILPITKFDYEEELICFNYLGTEPGAEKAYPCDKAYPLSYTASKTDFFLTCWKEACKNMVWNKFYKKDLLMRVYKKLPRNIYISFMEDTLLNLLVLAEVNTIRFENKAYYMYYFNSGDSTKTEYKDLETLQRLIRGFDTAIGLFDSAIPMERQTYSGISSTAIIKGSAQFFIKKYELMPDELKPAYTNLLTKYFDKSLFENMTIYERKE